MLIKDGPLTVQSASLTKGWRGIFVKAGKNKLRIQSSPKGRDLVIVPEVEKHHAVWVEVPNGVSVLVNCHQGHWYVGAYGPDGYIGHINLDEPRTEQL